MHDPEFSFAFIKYLKTYWNEFLHFINPTFFEAKLIQ